MDGAHGAVNDKIEGLLADGRALLASGRPQDAAFVFERVLLLAPADAAARAGLHAAQSASAEHDRAFDERLAAAKTRIDEGAHTDARALLDALVLDGGDSHRAAALLDRIPTPGGWFAPRRSEGEPALALAAGSPPGRSRMLLGAVCAALFIVLGAAVAGNWKGLMRRLAQAPVPHETSLAFAAPPGPRADDQTIATARRLLDDGDPARAVVLLDSVHPQQPSYPLARQIRGQAERALRHPGAR